MAGITRSRLGVGVVVLWVVVVGGVVVDVGGVVVGVVLAVGECCCWFCFGGI